MKISDWLALLPLVAVGAVWTYEAPVPYLYGLVSGVWIGIMVAVLCLRMGWSNYVLQRPT